MKWIFLYSRYILLFIVIISATALTAVSYALSNSARSFGSCVSEARGERAISADLMISLVETYCSALGEDASVSVIISSRKNIDKDRVAVFKYDPAREDIAPSISVRGSDIFLSISEISTVIDKKMNYGSYHIIYDIKKIDFP